MRAAGSASRSGPADGARPAPRRGARRRRAPDAPGAPGARAARRAGGALGREDRRVQLVLRIGYGEPEGERRPRRPVEGVLVE